MKTNNTYRPQELDFSGETLRDIGISIAVTNADSKVKDWTKLTYGLFKDFLKEQREPFQTEDFRSWIALNKPDYEWPPNLRAFGGIIVKAKNEKLIRTIGTRPVDNPKAHCANASLLVRV